MYDHRIHTCNYPDLQIELGIKILMRKIKKRVREMTIFVSIAGCNPSELLGGFVCPALEDLSPLEQRFYPFPR